MVINPGEDNLGVAAAGPLGNVDHVLLPEDEHDVAVLSPAVLWRSLVHGPIVVERHVERRDVGGGVIAGGKIVAYTRTLLQDFHIPYVIEVVTQFI